MATYYFDYRENGVLFVDSIGTVFETAAAARLDAVHALMEMARDSIQEAEARKLSIEVRAEGRAVLRLVLTLEVQLA